MNALLPDFDALWDYNNPAETEKRFRDLLPAAEQSGDASYTLQLLTQIARAQGLDRRFDDAHQTLDRVEAALTPDLTRARIRGLLERGRVFNSSRKPDEARPLFLAAWEQAQAANEHFYAIDAAHMLGIIEPPDQALEWNLKAVQLAEQTGDDRARKWLGSLYNNIGWTYHDDGQYEQALAIFQKALAYRQQQGEPSNIRIAHWCVGRALRSLGRIPEALDIQRALLAEHEAAGTSDGYVHEELAECLLLQGDAEAPAHFARAYAKLAQDPWLAENEPGRLARLKQLGQV